MIWKSIYYNLIIRQDFLIDSFSNLTLDSPFKNREEDVIKYSTYREYYKGKYNLDTNDNLPLVIGKRVGKARLSKVYVKWNGNDNAGDKDNAVIKRNKNRVDLVPSYLDVKNINVL